MGGEFDSPQIGSFERCQQAVLEEIRDFESWKAFLELVRAENGGNWLQKRVLEMLSDYGSAQQPIARRSLVARDVGCHYSQSCGAPQLIT